MKQEYNIKDQVWIHLGERKLVEGRVVEIIDLEHLKEGHSPDRELYIIEIKTGIDDVYEVRSFEQISSDANGPINLFRKNSKEINSAKRYLKKVGVQIPVDEPNHLLESVQEIHDDLGEETDPTPEQIHAAIERAEKAKSQHFQMRPQTAKRPAKKKTYNKRKKTNATSE